MDFISFVNDAGAELTSVDIPQLSIFVASFNPSIQAARTPAEVKSRPTLSVEPMRRMRP
jgi:hypothetical protein